jgi:adenylate kinase family enzyme
MEGGEMNDPQGIIIFGANGSGKTTLGRELARILGFKRMDAEDYFFRESIIPYSDARSKREVVELMLADIKKFRSFIISSVTGDYGSIIPQYYKLAVYMSAPHDLRMERVKKRTHDKLGDRILEGGDMYESEQKFFDFVATRLLSKIDQWAKTLTCPIIHIDGTVDWRISAINIADKWREL